MKEFTEEIMKNYFVDTLIISDKEILLAAAVSSGLDRGKAEEILNSSEYTDEVRKDEMNAQDLNITGVPHFIFDEKYKISGAQPVENFIDVLKAI